MQATFVAIGALRVKTFVLSIFSGSTAVLSHSFTAKR